MFPSLLVGFVAAVVPPPAWSVATPAWQLEDASSEQAARYKQHLDDALRDQGFRVVSPGEPGAPVKSEQVTQLRACRDDAGCLAKLGRELQVQAVVASRLKEFSDGSLQVQLSLVSSEDGQVLARTEASGGSEAELIRGLDEAALALEAGASMEQLPPANPTPTVRERSISSTGAAARGPPGPPPALTPYQNAIPSMSIVALDQPENAWIPAVSGGFIALLGAQQVADSQLRRRERTFVEPIGPQPEPTDYLARVPTPDPNRQQLAGLAGIGFGLAAIAGAYNVFQLGPDSPIRVEPFAGPTGGGIGITTRW